MYTGIARLARAGEWAEQKRRVTYHALPTRRLVNRCAAPRMPFDWTVNPYRGCEFGCRYCYARYTHEFMEFRAAEDFETRIFAKEFTADSVAAEILRLPRGAAIALGTATDPYQPAERRFGRTRRFLEAFSRMRGRSLAITTKGELARRDVDLFQTIARENDLRINFSITTLNARLARSLEPLAPRPDLRLAAVEALARAGLDVGVFASPVLPGLTDARRSLEAVARAASACGARRFGAQMLFLKPAAARVFLPWLSREFPALAGAYRGQFARAAYIRGELAERLAVTVRELRAKYSLAPHSQPGWTYEQLALFQIEK